MGGRARRDRREPPGEHDTVGTGGFGLVATTVAARVVLLGLRVEVSQVRSLGLTGFAIVAAVVATAFMSTQAIARVLKVPSDLGLLVATGFSICGASAIAAAEGVTGAKDEEVGVAIGLVTLFGSLAVIVLPVVGNLLDMPEEHFGAWAGASVHDVSQVVATASTAGTAAMNAAVLVKLTRVLMLIPTILWIGSRHSPTAADKSRWRVVPAFVWWFCAAAVLRNVANLPQGLLDVASDAEQVALTIAMVGIGLGVRLRTFRSLGPQPVVLGLLSWVIIAVVTLPTAAAGLL